MPDPAKEEAKRKKKEEVCPTLLSESIRGFSFLQYIDSMFNFAITLQFVKK